MTDTGTENAVKFLFETSFDEPDEPDIDPTAPEADAGMTNAAVESLRAEMFEAGRQQGLAEAKDAQEAHILALIGKVDGAITDLVENRRRVEANLSGQAAALGHAIAVKLCPALMQAHPLAEIEKLTFECLSELNGEPRLVVRLHSSMVPAMKDRIDALAAAAGFEGHAILIGDDEMGRLNCRVEWANGGAEYNLEDLVASAKTAVKRYLDTLAGEAEATSAAGSDPTHEQSPGQTPEPS